MINKSFFIRKSLLKNPPRTWIHWIGGVRSSVRAPNHRCPMLYELVQAHLNGNPKAKVFAKRSPKVHNARWLGWAIRAFQLYSTNGYENYDHLADLVEYIIKVYSPVYFTVKMRPTIRDGSKHMFETMRRSRYLPENQLAVVSKVIEDNSYFAHSDHNIFAGRFRAINLIKIASDNLESNKERIKNWCIRNRKTKKGSISVFAIFKNHPFWTGRHQVLIKW